MAQYEYQVIQMASGGRTTHLNERMDHMATEGWEPVMMSGDATINVMMRRPAQAGATQQVAQAQAAAAAPA